MNNHRASPLRTRRCHFRAAEHEARMALLKMGHSVVVRSADPAFPASLIAWSGTGGIHVFCVVSTRRSVKTVSDVTSLFSKEIGELRGIPRTPGGSLNLWVRTGRKAWKRYRVFPGGIAEEAVQDVA